MKENFDIAAYYWPAYHDEPRWRLFMPEGIGEWETVRQARAKFPGHYQPRVPAWGYTDEADPAVMAHKIDAALGHGVNVFIFDWYWYENQPFLDYALDRGFLPAHNSKKMSFYLMWANHNATTLWDLKRSHDREIIWPGAVALSEFEKATESVIEKYFSQPNYYQINGCPVFAIYELSTLIDGLGGLENTRSALDGFRERVQKAGFPDLHLQAILWSKIPAAMSDVPGDRSATQNDTVRFLGIDSLTNYQWCHYVRARGDYAAWAEQAVAAWAKWTAEFEVPFFPHVSVGWDTNPRFKELQSSVIAGNTPALFQKYFSQALAFAVEKRLSPRLITVNSWNEWSESSYLEPDLVYGMGYLEAIRSALTESE